jgi:biopolymer transport protein ExbB
MPAVDTSHVFEIGPITMGLMLAALIILVGLAIEQVWTYWNLIANARDLGGEVGKALYRGDLQAARTMCERSSSPVADVFIAALNKLHHQGESVQRAAERERQRLGLWMKRRLWAIGTVGAIAPFVGLFGTVVGIIRAFKDIASAGAGGFSVVAGGVSEALVATAGGILIAVIAVAFYNYFQSRAGRATVEVKLVVDEFLEQLAVTGDGAPPQSQGATPPRSVPSASDGSSSLAHHHGATIAASNGAT